MRVSLSICHLSGLHHFRRHSGSGLLLFQPNNCNDSSGLIIFIENVLTSALSSTSRPVHSRLTWNRSVDLAVTRVKDMFTSSPLLTRPDPKLQFMVEVEAWSRPLPKVFEDPALFPPRNELWTTKNCSPSRQRWRSGDTGFRGGLFLVWTDNRNLDYLQMCEMPRLKDQKPDAFSRIHISNPTSENPDYLLPRVCKFWS